jgi:hypothetical protein
MPLVEKLLDASPVVPLVFPVEGVDGGPSIGAPPSEGP